MRTLHLDFETFSPLDLKSVGVENYVRSPGFAVTCVGWAFDDEHPLSTVWPSTALPHEVREHIAKGGTIKAWNAAFEFNILNLHYNVSPTHEQFECVMQRALAYGLPGKLETAGPAMGLAIVKDATARRLMLKMGKPKKDGTAWHICPTAGQMLDDLAAYCRQDVAAERALDRVIPPLHPFERRLSLVDARINEAGVLIDEVGAAALGQAALFQQKLYAAECTALTNGAVDNPGTETAKLMAWLKGEGVPIPNVNKETVAAALASKPGYPAKVHRVLELRQMAAKASVAKIIRMVQWASIHDGRARNGLQFYGAGRTGRWAGRGIQVQNLPRVPKGFKPDDVIKVAAAEPSALGLLWPSPMQAISRSLRALLIARPNHTLVSIDLSQIEARVLAWLAGQQDVLAQFASGVDIYVNTAAKHGSANRQLGKVLVLACGFGIGAQKFKDTAEKDYGVVMTLSEATTKLMQWRQDNAAIVAYWKTVQNAVEASVQQPGAVIPIGRIMVRTQKGVTQIRKPNGVKLTYHNMRFEKWGSGLVFDGVNSLTKKWGTERTYGGKLVENVTQSVARDVMAEALLASARLPVMTVHDDIVWEVEQEWRKEAAEELRQIVEEAPAWTSGLPIASEIKISRRYGGS